MRTMYKFVEDETAKVNDDVVMRSARMSDVLALMWMRADTIELRAVEELLRQLSGVIAPQVPVRFLPHEEPGYRSALRMQLGDILIPAAIGGVLNPWPNMPEGVSAACVQIYLEPWAASQSGQVIELAHFSPKALFEENRSQ
jgi:hypothetical protein